MSIFDRLDRMTSRQVDRMYAVRATIDPMSRSPNGRAAPDATRGTIHLKGVFDQAPAYDAIEFDKRERSGNDLKTISAGTAYQFSFDVIRYPYADLIRQGDRLTLDDARKFEVVSVERDGLSRAVARLTRFEG